MSDSKHILIVDDDAGSREIFSKIVTMGGYAVETAADGIEAVEKILKGTFDLVLLDAMLPKLDGLSVLATLKEKNALAKAGAVILCTNLLGQSIIDQAKANGAADVLCKTDFSAGVLLGKIKELTEKSKN